MTPEGEVGRFRKGESTGKPLGGNVADEPFAQKLYGLARSRGFESQLGLARALGKKGNGIVSEWYRGKSVPTPEEFGKLLILLKPTDEELEPLAAEYGVQLEAGRGNKMRLVGSEVAQNVGRRLMKPSADPLGRWIEDIAGKRKISLAETSERLGLSIKGQSRGKLGLDAVSKILESAPQGFGLTPEEIEGLADAVARFIGQRLRKGKRFQSISGPGLLKIQNELSCRTYNAEQVGQILGRSRERIRQLRKRYGFPMLMTDEHVRFLASRDNSGYVTNNAEVAEILGVSVYEVMRLKGRRKWRGILTPEQIEILKNRLTRSRPGKEVGAHPVSERQDPSELTGTISLH